MSFLNTEQDAYIWQFNSTVLEIMFPNYSVVGANTFSKPVLLFCSFWQRGTKALGTSTGSSNTPYSSPPSLAVTQSKHRQLPIHGEMQKPSSFHDPRAISQVQRDTCTLVTGKGGSGLVMREGAWSLLDPPCNSELNSQDTEVLKIWILNLGRLPPIKMEEKKKKKEYRAPKISLCTRCSVDSLQSLPAI